MAMRITMEVTRTMMNKRFGSVLWGMAILASVATMQSGCVSRNFDLGTTPQYQAQINAIYELREDSYLVTIRNVDELWLVNGYSRYRLPLPVNSKYIGKSTSDLNIKGIVPKGTLLKVISVRGSESFDAGYSVDFYLQPVGSMTGLAMRINAYHLQRFGNGLYWLDERSFRPVTGKECAIESAHSK